MRSANQADCVKIGLQSSTHKECEPVGCGSSSDDGAPMSSVGAPVVNALLDCSR